MRGRRGRLRNRRDRYARLPLGSAQSLILAFSPRLRIRAGDARLHCSALRRYRRHSYGRVTNAGHAQSRDRPFAHRRHRTDHRVGRARPTRRTARTRASAPITAFRLAGNARSMPSGPTRLLMPPYRQSGNTWRFTRTGSTPSKSASKTEQAVLAQVTSTGANT